MRCFESIDFLPKLAEDIINVVKTLKNCLVLGHRLYTSDTHPYQSLAMRLASCQY